MILHDRETEQELLEIAGRVAGAKGLERPDGKTWSRRASISLHYGIWLFATCMLTLSDLPTTAEHALCALVMMLLIRDGRNHLGATANDCGLFGVLVNLPITVKRALTHIRARFVLRFWLPSVLFPVPLALELHRPSAAWPEIAASAFLLTTICWATIILADSDRMARLKGALVWHIAAIALIAHLIFLHYLGGGLAEESPAYSSSEGVIDHMLWIFPPAWVFPGKAEAGGNILAGLWIAAGFWSWFRWPVTAMPAYDKPHDFIGAFGSFGYDDSETAAENFPGENEDTEDDVVSDAPAAMPSDGWLDRLILRAIRADDRTVAGAMADPEQTWTRRANAALVFAPLWLLGIWLFGRWTPDFPQGDFLLIAIWGLPLALFIVTLFPYSNPMAFAFSPYPLGAFHVPFHSMAPVATRGLLRIAQRIRLVRCCLFGLVPTPFFHGMAVLQGYPQFAGGLALMIPAAMVFWILSTPIMVSSKIRSSLRRKSGILPLHFANSVVILSLSVLWLVTGIGGVASAFFFASEGSEEGRVFLLPAAIGGLLLSAVFSRVVFEIVHNEIRHRRYDWISKMT